MGFYVYFSDESSHDVGQKVVRFCGNPRQNVQKVILINDSTEG